MPTIRLVPLPLILLALAGCSESKSRPQPSAESKTSTVSTSPSQPAASSTEPSANGTGCPPGSAHVTREGNTVTVTFDRFAAEVSPKAKFAVKDCNVLIPTTGEKRVSVASFTLDGEANMEKGVNAKLMFETNIQGKPDEVRGTQRGVDGPSDKPLQFARKFDDAQRLWTDCGVARSLNSVARFRLEAGDEDAPDVVPGNGKAKPTKLTIELEEKPCSDS